MVKVKIISNKFTKRVDKNFILLYNVIVSIDYYKTVTGIKEESLTAGPPNCTNNTQPMHSTRHSERGKNYEEDEDYVRRDAAAGKAHRA